MKRQKLKGQVLFVCYDLLYSIKISQYINKVIEKNTKNDFKIEQTKRSVITEHILNYSYTFDRDNVKILDSECNYCKRFVS